MASTETQRAAHITARGRRFRVEHHSEARECSVLDVDSGERVTTLLLAPDGRVWAVRARDYELGHELAQAARAAAVVK